MAILYCISCSVFLHKFSIFNFSCNNSIFPSPGDPLPCNPHYYHYPQSQEDCSLPCCILHHPPSTFSTLISLCVHLIILCTIVLKSQHQTSSPTIPSPFPIPGWCRQPLHCSSPTFSPMTTQQHHNSVWHSHPITQAHQNPLSSVHKDPSTHWALCPIKTA